MVSIAFFQVKYKSDLNWIKGIGWTPPGSYKVEMARRAAELAYAQGMAPGGTYGQYEHGVVSGINRTSHKTSDTTQPPREDLSSHPIEHL